MISFTQNLSPSLFRLLPGDGPGIPSHTPFRPFARYNATPSPPQPEPQPPTPYASQHPPEANGSPGPGVVGVPEESKCTSTRRSSLRFSSHGLELGLHCACQYPDGARNCEKSYF